MLEREKKINDKLITYCLKEKNYLEIVLSNDFNVDDFLLNREWERFEKQQELKRNKKETDSEWEQIVVYAKLFKIIKKYYELRNDVLNPFFVEELFNKKKIEKNTYIFYKTIENNNIDFSENDLIDTIESKKGILVEKKSFEFAYNVVNGKLDFENESNIIASTLADILAINQKSNNDFDFNINLNQGTEEAKMEYLNPELAGEVIKTGFTKIDESISFGGMKRTHLCYIMGRKAAGKSLLMMNMAHNIWKQHKNVMIITLEVSRKEYISRIHSYASKLAINKLVKANYESEDEKQTMIQCLDYFAQNKDEDGNKINGIFSVKFMERGTRINMIEKFIEAAEKRFSIKYDAIVIDYADILEPVKPCKEDRQKYGQIAAELKGLAQRKDCVVISGVQMNREGAKAEFITSSHTANSDAIANELDLGIAIKIDDNPNINEGTIKSFKNRHGSDFYFSFEKCYDRMAVVEKTSIDDIAKDISNSINNDKGWGFGND